MRNRRGRDPLVIGMVIGVIIALLLTPVVYLVVERLRENCPACDTRGVAQSNGSYRCPECGQLWVIRWRWDDGD